MNKRDNDVARPPDREPGTRPDGEAMPPKAIDPKPDGKQDKSPRPNADATGF